MHYNSADMYDSAQIAQQNHHTVTLYLYFVGDSKVTHRQSTSNSLQHKKTINLSLVFLQFQELSMPHSVNFIWLLSVAVFMTSQIVQHQ